jgi:hypothetical protein
MGHSLIHMDGTRIQGRWEDLTGEPHPDLDRRPTSSSTARSSGEGSGTSR